jgi:hypothetical protein
MKAKFAAGILALAILIGANSAALAQDDTTEHSAQTATGCLMKVGASNAYTLTDENGKTWDLRGSVPLDPHVGHTITVTGTIPKEPKGIADTSPQNHLVVTKVEKVRDECKQP